jgi:quinohemoprotein ethanol dehydrogenase
MKTIIPATFFVIVFFSFNCNQVKKPGTPEFIREVTSKIDDESLISADKTPGDWLSNGRNYSEDRYSALTQISKENVQRLGLAWSLNLGTTRGIEATPIVVNGIMYISGPWSIVYSIDARTGKQLWMYDPKVPGRYGQKTCCDVVNRGVAIYKGKIYSGTLDGRLLCLDAVSGKLDWQVNTTDTTKPYSITGAPRIVDGKVIIGNGGADFGVRGYVTAYDAQNGKQVWRFYTVPGDPSKPFESKTLQTAAKTWNGDWWKYGGGGTAWDAMAYDPALKLLYIGTGNGSPWNRHYRSPDGGDNLFLCSILALNPGNGKLVWYYQTTPGEQWDYTSTQPFILADIDMNGEKKKVIMLPKTVSFMFLTEQMEN